MTLEWLLDFYKETRKVRDEILELLTPIVVRTNTEAVEEHLNVLVENIETSGLCFAPHLRLESRQIEWFDSVELRGGRSDARGIYRFQKTTLQLPGGGEWVLETTVDYGEAPVSGAYVYGIIHNILHIAI
jgi:hypothetical protein